MDLNRLCIGCAEALAHSGLWGPAIDWVQFKRPVRMSHIHLPEGVPGISAGFSFRPETAKPLRELAHVLLHSSVSETFNAAERELVATFVSSRNSCYFCMTSHGAVASHLHGDAGIVGSVCSDYLSAPISPKMKSFLAIAEQVQIDGKRVTKELVDRALAEGATEVDVHDVILVASAFCMFNRYVDGLGTWQPRDESMYAEMGRQLAENGYLNPTKRH